MSKVAMVQMDKQLHTQMKIKVAIEKKSIKAVVDELVQNWLMEEPKNKNVEENENE